MILSLLKKSLYWSFTIVTGISTIISLWGYTIKDFNASWQWWKGGLVLGGCFAFLSGILFLILLSQRHRPYQTVINGKRVVIKTGDIFAESGWKLIPFNDRFDTTVDDRIIAHDSLNGKMIDAYVDDPNNLSNAIIAAGTDLSPFQSKVINGHTVYPLGRVIPYNSFLLLAFSHFDQQNKAFIGIGEYEQMLIRMWSEIRRVYAAKPVSVPLIGTGITNIEGVPEKNYTDLLKCMLCTLKNSRFAPEKGITIVLTQEAMDKVDMNVIKEEF